MKVAKEELRVNKQKHTFLQLYLNGCLFQGLQGLILKTCILYFLQQCLKSIREISVYISIFNHI